MFKNLFNWVDDRTGIAKLTREALFEHVPGGARWRYIWGSTLSFAIMVQFITGVFLWMAYSPSAITAWESVFYIQNEMPGGWLLRGIHHWTAQIMVVLLVLHLVQVVIDSAYRAPREFNFWFGVLLLFLTLGISLTGYLLPWDQKGFWATKVATNLTGIVPFIGEDLQKVVIGGSDYGNATLTRFFALHAGVLPGALVGLIVVHIYLFRKHGITEAKPATRAGALYYWSLGAFVAASVVVIAFGFGWGKNGAAWVPWVLVGVLAAVLGRLAFLIKNGKDDDSASRPKRDGMFWPDQIFRDAIACFAVMAAVLFFVFWKGTELMAPANPAQAYDAARPDWYFMSLFQLLEFDVFSGGGMFGKFGIILGAIVVPSILAGIVFLMPLIGKTSTGHWVNVILLYGLIGGFIWLTALGFSHDAKDEDYKHEVELAHAEAERTKELIKVRGGIPPEGALSLLYVDPLTRGPRLFQEKCASCHAFDGHDGRGQKRSEEQIASDLHGFGSREWVAGILDPEKILDVDHFGGTKFAEKSKMIDFVTEDLADLDEDDKADLAKVVKALSAEAHLKSQVSMDQADAAAIEEGRVLMGEDGFDCTSCHKFYDEGRKGPELTNYASRTWLVEFIKNPEHKLFYGTKNDNMPVFGPKEEEDGSVRSAILSDADIGLIADWIRGEWDVSGEDPAVRKMAAEQDAARWAAAKNADAEREAAQAIEDAAEEATEAAEESFEAKAAELEAAAKEAMEKAKAATEKATAEKAAAEKAAAEAAAAAKKAAEALKAAEEAAKEAEATDEDASDTAEEAAEENAAGDESEAPVEE